MRLLHCLFFLFPVLAAALDGSYYDLLGVAPSAAARDIKKSYRKMSVALHPDKLIGSSPGAIAQAQARFIEVSKAYEVLTDAVMRKRYDHILAQGEKEYDHHRNWDWVDQQLGIKAMHHRQSGRAEQAGMRTFTFEEAERLFNHMREEAEREEVLESEALPWYIAVALVLFFAAIVGVPVWWWLFKRTVQLVEKTKKKAAGSEAKARLAEQVRQQQTQEDSVAEKKKQSQPRDVQPKKSGKVVFTRDDIVVKRALGAQSLLLPQVLLDIEEHTTDLNEFASDIGVIAAFRDWLFDLQPAENENETAGDEGDENDADELAEQSALSAALKHTDCLLQIALVHLGRDNALEVWEAHFENNPTVTERMDPAILSRLRLCACAALESEELSSASVPFEDIFPELLANLSSLLCQHASDLFDEFASDPEHTNSIIASCITLRDCLECRASRVRFEPHVHMEGLYADFQLWEAMQGLLAKIEAQSDEDDAMSAYCQELFEQAEEQIVRVHFGLASTLKECAVQQTIDDNMLSMLSDMAHEVQATTQRSLEASYARFQRGVVLVVGEEQESKEMTKLIKEVFKLISADSGNDDEKGKKKKNKKQQQRKAK